ncbi:MAG: MBL fold metallo-hydrolase, partial [Candidatus Heimdallarchaeota archaeon]|nr:MBL fold metallo-hydrolase [Candidatus Heimdallarchaeota archaeon]
MVDYEAISVIIFKVKNNQPYFYLVKRGSALPTYPDTWTPIAGAINKNDENVYSYLYDKVGTIIDDMASRLTAVRLLIERNLLNPFEEDQRSKSDLDVYERMKQIDPDVLSVYLHSMFPVGIQKIDDGKNTFNTRHFIYISSRISFFERIKLVRKSSIYTDSQYIIETKSRWFSVNQIISYYKKSTKLFSPSFVYLIDLISCEGMKLTEAARKVEETLETKETIDYQIIPFIWRFVTPALTLPPFHTNNIYVIGDETKYIIDPGANSALDIVNLLGFIEDHINEIEGIILTSANADHCNQVFELKERYNFPICASHNASEIMKKKGCVVNHVLKEGDRIPLGTYKPTDMSNWFM